MTLLELIDQLWWSIKPWDTYSQNEYRKIYDLMEKGEITQEQCYNQMKLLFV